MDNTNIYVDFAALKEEVAHDVLRTIRVVLARLIIVRQFLEMINIKYLKGLEDLRARVVDAKRLVAALAPRLNKA